MFTIEQIKTAHSKVKSGADFPDYVQDLIKLGVIYYETYVTHGHTDYFGNNNFKVSSTSKDEIITISDKANKHQFEKDLKAHQQGESDYLTFCEQAGNSGVEKWVVDMGKMACTYYNNAGNEMLREVIPSV